MIWECKITSMICLDMKMHFHFDSQDALYMFVYIQYHPHNCACVCVITRHWAIFHSATLNRKRKKNILKSVWSKWETIAFKFFFFSFLAITSTTKRKSETHLTTKRILRRWNVTYAWLVGCIIIAKNKLHLFHDGYTNSAS